MKQDGSMDTSKKNCVITTVEHKMGIKGSATSMVLFEESVW